ncbi:MAG: hypothetical protein ACTSW1_08245 [Candidatus Hodarchaeales archaeon]
MIKTAKIDDRQIQLLYSRIRKIEQKQGSDFLLRLGVLINTSIRTRVQDKGQGLKGKMPKYKDKYARFREKKGRDVSIRNLTFKGTMFNALGAEKLGADKVILSFGSGEENIKAFGNNELTPFFGIGPDEEKVIDDASSKFMRELVL